MINALLSRTMIFAIKAYRYFIGPVLGQHCRFHPTCSAYAIEAIEQHGAVRGGWLAVHRLVRCQPLSEGGVDPVPPRKASLRERAAASGSVNSEPSLARDSR
jgi:uncharacterized protein